MKVNKYILMGLASLSLVGCADLDTEPQGSRLTATQKADVYLKDPSKVSAEVTGITSMFSIYANAWTAAERHNDFGYPSVMLFTDSRGMDMVSDDIGYNWFSDGLDFNDRLYSEQYTKIIWSTLYNQIYTTNSLIALLDENSEDEKVQFYIAQAFGIRAFDYFVLAQLYQFTYADSKDLPCVPLILDSNRDEAATNGAPRSTVGEVYAQIKSDIDKAVALLGKTSVKRSDKRYMNLQVALALRARINLVMQNWNEAAADAQKVIESKEFTPLTIAQASKPGFNDLADKNWIWGIKIEETDRVVTTGICNWPSHMCSLSYGYASVGAWRRVSKALFDKIGNDDARKGWFLDGDKKSTNLTDAQASYVVENKIPAYVNVKFAPYADKLGQAVNANDIPLIRIEEMYLILAEAQAMGGNPALGAQTLTEFVKSYRAPSYTCSATSATDVQDAVWFQRRVELWGEGLSYFDIMRLKKGIDRRGAGFAPEFVFNIDYKNDNLTYQIPKAEIEGNGMISNDDNNPSASKPDPVKDEE